MKQQIAIFVLAAITLPLVFGCGTKQAPPPDTGGSSDAGAKGDVICSYAPSQSNVVAAVSGAAGGASVALPAIASAVGLTTVAHSSGAYILTGSAGYIAGTLGTAVAGPAIVVTSIVVGGAAVAVELVCVNKNHPYQVAKVEAASAEFRKRFESAVAKSQVWSDETIRPTTSGAVLKIKTITGDVFDYANRASDAVIDLFSE